MDLVVNILLLVLGIVILFSIVDDIAMRRKAIRILEDTETRSIDLEQRVYDLEQKNN